MSNINYSLDFELSDNDFLSNLFGVDDKNIQLPDFIQAVPTVFLINEKKILGAALDVLEFENKSFENLSESLNSSPNLSDLINSKKILLKPHIAGWTYESKISLVKIILKKIKKVFDK